MPKYTEESLKEPLEKLMGWTEEDVKKMAKLTLGILKKFRTDPGNYNKPEVYEDIIKADMNETMKLAVSMAIGVALEREILANKMAAEIMTHILG